MAEAAAGRSCWWRQRKAADEKRRERGGGRRAKRWRTTSITWQRLDRRMDETRDHRVSRPSLAERW